MNMNLKELMQTMGVQMGQVVSNPYARAFAPQVEVVKEAEDHEVSMAQNQLDSIIKAATELKAKIGESEKDIPAWIQDHITNSENYISQAASNYHEYGTNESINEFQTGFSNKKIDAKIIADRMRKYSETKNFADKIEKLKMVSAQDLDKILPDYIAGSVITKIFKESVNEAISKKDIEKLTSYKDFISFYKSNSKNLKKADVPRIVDEIESLKYLESDYKRGDADREEVLVAVEEIQDLLVKSLSVKERVNEEFKHTIYVDTPTQVVSKKIAAEIEALAKKGVRSKEIGLKMGFVGNQKAATDAFQKVKNQIYFKLDKANESVNEARLTNIVKSIVETPVIGKMVGSRVNEVVYNIGAGYMGNGLTIWNRAVKENGDYKIIAHIDPYGKISIRDKQMPSKIKSMIEDWAEALKKGDN